MSQLFRKEALARRSRALYGEVRLRTPLRPIWIGLAILLSLGLIGFILFGIPVSDGTVWSWLRA